MAQARVPDYSDCVYCQEDFASPEGLLEHIRTEHKGTYAYEDFVGIGEELKAMHSTEWKDLDAGTTYVMHHNGDFSGDVHIECYDPSCEAPLVAEMTVPFDALVELVGGAVLSKSIRQLEQRTGKEILGL
jgi:hypothetical protein